MEEIGKHCTKCRFVWKLYVKHDVVLPLKEAQCPMPDVCKYLDVIEFECDQTRILPKVVIV